MENQLINIKATGKKSQASKQAKEGRHSYG